MHLQHPTSATSTAIMGYTPPSPTLTNPDMILPYAGPSYDSDEASSPSHTLGPLSPQEIWDNSRPGDRQYAIAPPSGRMSTPTTPIIYGNGTMLSDIGEVTEAETTPRKMPGPAERRALKQAHVISRVSSTQSLQSPKKWAKVGAHERRGSMESNSTITSEAHGQVILHDFDDTVSVDDSCFQGDDEESVVGAYSYGNDVSYAKVPAWNVGNDTAAEEDPNSSAALSRRAEQILLNAKKRLNASSSDTNSSHYLTTNIEHGREPFPRSNLLISYTLSTDLVHSQQQSLVEDFTLNTQHGSSFTT